MRAMIRDGWHRSFLGHLLARDRRLGIGFLTFFVLQGIAQVSNVELTPFFLFGMYSDVIPAGQHYTRVTCHVNGIPVSQAQLPRNAGELFFSALYRFEQLERSGYNDRFSGVIAEKFGAMPAPLQVELARHLSFQPDQVPAFGNWASRYLSVVLNEPVEQLRIGRETYHYVNHRPVLMHSEDLLVVPSPPNAQR